MHARAASQREKEGGLICPAPSHVPSVKFPSVSCWSRLYRLYRIVWPLDSYFRFHTWRCECPSKSGREVSQQGWDSNPAGGRGWMVRGSRNDGEYNHRTRAGEFFSC